MENVSVTANFIINNDYKIYKEKLIYNISKFTIFKFLKKNVYIYMKLILYVF